MIALPDHVVNGLNRDGIRTGLYRKVNALRLTFLRADDIPANLAVFTFDERFFGIRPRLLCSALSRLCFPASVPLPPLPLLLKSALT